MNASIVINLLMLALQLSVLYYLKSVQELGCKCVEDWRRTAAMLITVLGASFNILSIAMPEYTVTLPMIFLVVLLVLQVIYAYALFTYVGDLNETQCDCAVKNHPYLNNFLWYYRYIPVLSAILLGALAVMKGRAAFV